MNRTMKRLAIPVVAAAVLGTSGFAFMSNNTFSSTPGAGEGQVHASGYDVNAIHNVGCGSGQPTICYTNFNLQTLASDQADAATVLVRFDNSGWFDCTTGGYAGPHNRSFTCDLRSAPVPSSYNSFQVSAIG